MLEVESVDGNRLAALAELALAATKKCYIEWTWGDIANPSQEPQQTNTTLMARKESDNAFFAWARTQQALDQAVDILERKGYRTEQGHRVTIVTKSSPPTPSSQYYSTPDVLPVLADSPEETSEDIEDTTPQAPEKERRRMPSNPIDPIANLERRRRFFRHLLLWPAILIVVLFLGMVFGVELPIAVSVISCVAAAVLTIGGVGAVLLEYRLKDRS